MEIKKILLISSSILLLSGCDKVHDLISTSIKCNDDNSKELLVNTFKDNLSAITNTQVKQLIKDDNITLDMAKVRSNLNNLNIQVDDIRTNNTDPNSKKNFCVTKFSISFPQEMLKDANESRELNHQNNVEQAATLADLSLEQGKLNNDLEYVIQPTDDGKKLYLTLDNAQSLVNFSSQIVLDSLLKNIRKTAVEQAQQEKIQQQQAEENAQREYQSVLVAEAKQNLNQANNEINLVWNSTTPEIRNQLLPEQRIWLKKRTLECQTESTKFDNAEVARLNCETNLTKSRTIELRNKIFYMN